MAMSHVPCLSAADNLLLIREAIIAIAQKHLLHATFLPKYNSAAAGSGSHVHLSIWQGASNVFMARGPGAAHGMSKIGQEFLAGVLHHLPAILAFTAPSPNRSVHVSLSSSISASCKFWSFAFLLRKSEPRLSEKKFELHSLHFPRYWFHVPA
jgi:hypothetical protein